MMPLVSAVITTHNRKDLLFRAVASAESQTYPNMEIIVVDDKSTDGTKELMEQYAASSSVRYIYNADGGGGNKARNTGILAAHGEYVAFLDDDDEWMPEKTAKQIELVEKKPDIGVVSCAKIFEYDLTRRKNQNLDELMEGDLHQRVFERIPLTTSCMMVRRDLLMDVGMFDENLRYWQEYELTIRLCQRTEIGCVKEHLILFRLNSMDKHRLTNKLDGWEEAVAYIDRKHGALLETLPAELRHAHEILIARDGSIRCENCGDKKRMRQYLKRLAELDPTWKNKLKYILNRRMLRR